MIPAIFTARPGEFIAELAALKTNNDAYAVFKDFVKDCYWLNGMMLPNVNFGHSLNKLLVESCLAGFLFTKGVTDTALPISYFKVWWMFVDAAYFDLQAVNAMTAETRGALVDKIRTEVFG